MLTDARAGSTVVSGVEDLVVLNTTHSEFWGFPRDGYTTLAETKDRILATQVSATWRYRRAEADWSGAYALASEALLEAFASTYSYSLQQTLYAMGTRIVETVPDVCEVRLALPNKHHFSVDLEPFGMPAGTDLTTPPIAPTASSRARCSPTTPPARVRLGLTGPVAAPDRRVEW